MMASMTRTTETVIASGTVAVCRPDTEDPE